MSKPKKIAGFVIQLDGLWDGEHNGVPNPIVDTLLHQYGHLLRKPPEFWIFVSNSGVFGGSSPVGCIPDDLREAISRLDEEDAPSIALLSTDPEEDVKSRTWEEVWGHLESITENTETTWGRIELFQAVSAVMFRRTNDLIDAHLSPNIKYSVKVGEVEQYAAEAARIIERKFLEERQEYDA